ncbi:MAG TPA: IS4 family transposase [Polyangiaceae bacterium]|jgi:putative transposase|nr:IS4 family transposase [Polyangiaceae bacterium]
MELAVLPRLYRPLKSELAPDPLREHIAAAVELCAVKLLDPARLEAIAEDMGLVQKKRVHHAGLIVCAVILSAFQRSTDTQGRWLDAQRIYEAIGGPRATRESFHKQVVKLAPLMRALVRRRFDDMTARASRNHLRGRLSHFADVLVPDGCGFKLAKALSGMYTGTGVSAQLKLHAVYSVGAGDCVSAKATAGSVHDSDEFWPEWEADALYIWDLGYQGVDRFVDAALSGAHVIQRLKDNHNPQVLASYGPSGARRALDDGEGGPVRIEQALAFGLVHKQAVLDLDVRLVDHNRRALTARVVCVPFEGEDRYYLTTLPREIFSPHDVAELYRVRWEVELLFRAWKGAMRLDEVRRLQTQASIEAAVSASLLAASLSRDLAFEFERLTNQGIDTAPDGAFPPSAARTATATATVRIRRSTPARHPDPLRDRAAARSRAHLSPGHDPRGRTR